MKATFTADHISAPGKFGPRLLSVHVGAWWTGNNHQLLTFMKQNTERLREVKTIDFMGYTKEYGAYIFENMLCIRVTLSTLMIMISTNWVA